MDFVDSIEFPLVKEERANTDTVYIKCEVKEENTSDFLEDTSTDQYHSDPHSSWTLERETPENYSFTHHHPSEVQTHTRGPSRREKGMSFFVVETIFGLLCFRFFYFMVTVKR